MMQHYYKSVGGWAAFAPLYFEMAKSLQDGMVLVEIGSWLGRSAALMGVEIENSGKNVKLHCVDPWLDGGPDLRDTSHFKNQTQPIYDQFLHNTAQVSRHIVSHRGFSVDVASEFKDNSIDYIMIDGDHSYEAVKADIQAWRPKMKKGGLMSGDDYGWPGVSAAVDQCFSIDSVSVTWIKKHHNYLLGASYWSVRV